eukprot:7393778-Prorocentrum_lima.AAC.1
MTSSLVGSEMCIRDSTPPGELVLSASSVGHAGQDHPHLHYALHPAPAVSYTHLTLPTICSV